MIPLVACGASSERNLHYEPDIVEVVGRIVFEERYGPPNYGETPELDTKELVPVLHLEHSISVEPRPGTSENLARLRGIDRIQIQLNTEAPAVEEFAGACTTVRGSLFEATTGHHSTPVVLHLIAIERSDECSHMGVETEKKED